MPIIKGSKKKEDSLRMALELTQIRNILCLIIGHSLTCSIVLRICQLTIRKPDQHKGNCYPVRSKPDPESMCCLDLV